MGAVGPTLRCHILGLLRASSSQHNVLKGLRSTRFSPAFFSLLCDDAHVRAASHSRPKSSDHGVSIWVSASVQVWAVHIPLSAPHTNAAPVCLWFPFPKKPSPPPCNGPATAEPQPSGPFSGKQTVVGEKRGKGLVPSVATTQRLAERKLKPQRWRWFRLQGNK